jgi:hypothetical protein
MRGHEGLKPSATPGFRLFPQAAYDFRVGRVTPASAASVESFGLGLGGQAILGGHNQEKSQSHPKDR